MSTARETIAEEIDRLIAERRRRESVQCPACEYVFDLESLAGWCLVKLWGSQDGAEEVECPGCEQPLLVTEKVSRTYEVQVNEAIGE